jgi:selenium metabolism protein YedF
LGDAPSTTVFISSDRIGSGDDELGALLMRGFLRTLAESGDRPARVILMNGGVKLAIEGAQTAPSLASLAEAGVEVLACGTCLDFYKVKEKLIVGRVSNMLEIAGLLLAGRTLSV